MHHVLSCVAASGRNADVPCHSCMAKISHDATCALYWCTTVSLEASPEDGMNSLTARPPRGSARSLRGVAWRGSAQKRHTKVAI